MIQKKPAGSHLIFVVTLLSVILLSSAESLSLPANKIENILFYKDNSTETVTIYLKNSPNKIKNFVLHDNERIVIDINNAFVPDVRISKETGGDIVEKVRIGQNRKDTARIVLDIKEGTLYQFSIEEMDNDGKGPGVKITTYTLSTRTEPVSAPELHPPSSRKDEQLKEKPDIPSQEKHALGEGQVEPGKGESLVLFDDNDLPADIFTEPSQVEEESDFTISGLVQIRTSLDTDNEDVIEHETSLRNRILLESEYRNTFTLSVLSDYLYFGPEDKTDEYDLDLYEATYTWDRDNIDLTFGKQIIRWGKTDRISPVDTINPTDLREFIIPEYEENKIPIWMADLNLFFNSSRLEIVAIPFFEEADLDYFQNDWAVFPHLKEELQGAPLHPDLKRYFHDIRVHEEDPAGEAELGLRFTSTIASVDFDLSWHHTREDIPYFSNFPVKNIRVDGDFTEDKLLSALDKAILTDGDIEVEYRRTETAGFAFETTLADFGLRGEAAWHENQSYLTSSLTSVRRPVFEYILGADYTTAGETYLNLQFAQRHIYDYDPEILYFDQDTYSLLGEVSRDVLSNWLEACLYYSVTLNNSSLYLSPRLEYTYITNLDLTLGANIFNGDGDTWLGRFDDNDQLFLDISYHF